LEFSPEKTVVVILLRVVRFGDGAVNFPNHASAFGPHRQRPHAFSQLALLAKRNAPNFEKIAALTAYLLTACLDVSEIPMQNDDRNE